jgi:hypothetical protein
MLRRFAVAAAALAAIILAAGQTSRSQTPATHQWEYATVEEGEQGSQQTTANGAWVPYSNATICRATSQGCQAEKVTAEYAGTLKAASLLGERGWELVSAAHSPANGRTILYFRRPKGEAR